MSFQGVDQQKAWLSRRLVKVGDKICLPDIENLKRVKPELVETIKHMDWFVGSGPFDLLGVEYFPTDGVPLFILSFVDKSGKKTGKV